MSGYGVGKSQKRGPYGTNEGDIWSAEDSPVGKMLLERDGRVLIHEVLDGEEKVYNVELSNPRPEMQDLIRRAREGVDLYFAAQAANN